MVLKLKKNARAGIFPKRDGQTVEVIFCVNARVKSFEDKLPTDVSDRLQPGWFPPFQGRPLKPKGLSSSLVDSTLNVASSPQKNFPYVSTLETYLDADLVNLMAHQASYSLLTGLQKLEFNVDKLNN